MILKAVFFDLDDTIYDHQYSRRCGLRVLRNQYPALEAVPIEEMEREHEHLLQVNYLRTLDGTMTVDEARLERIKALCGMYGVKLEAGEAKRLVDRYHAAYVENQRAVPGAVALLSRLKADGLIIGVITNGPSVEQREKLRLCGVEGLLDIILISEEVGFRKPDKAIFALALDTAGAAPDEAVFIGDNWRADILGAHACGIGTVWLNRYGETCLDPGMTVEMRELEPLGDVIKAVYGAYPLRP